MVLVANEAHVPHARWVLREVHRMTRGSVGWARMEKRHGLRGEGL